AVARVERPYRRHPGDHRQNGQGENPLPARRPTHPQPQRRGGQSAHRARAAVLAAQGAEDETGAEERGDQTSHGRQRRGRTRHTPCSISLCAMESATHIWSDRELIRWEQAQVHSVTHAHHHVTRAHGWIRYWSPTVVPVAC